MKPDLILAWPRNCDYPLFRQYIHDHRAEFNEIIVVFTETNQGHDFTEFLRNAMLPDHVLTFHNRPIMPGEDWRDVAVNSALLHSYNAPWVMFMEQDFFIKDGFWEAVNNFVSLGMRAIGVKDQTRLHPCCLILQRSLLNELDKNFGIVPDKSDHFGLIQKQLEEKNEPIGIIAETDYHHMNGLSHNISLLQKGELVTYQPEEFKAYLKDCLLAKIPQDERFLAIIKSAGITQ